MNKLMPIPTLDRYPSAPPNFDGNDVYIDDIAPGDVLKLMHEPDPIPTNSQKYREDYALVLGVDERHMHVLHLLGTRKGIAESTSLADRGLKPYDGYSAPRSTWNPVNHTQKLGSIDTSLTPLTKEQAIRIKILFEGIEEAQMRHGIQPVDTLTFEELALNAFIEFAIRREPIWGPNTSNHPFVKSSH